jgi:hypothetical protein
LNIELHVCHSISLIKTLHHSSIIIGVGVLYELGENHSTKIILGDWRPRPLLPFMYISDSLTDERPENKPDQRKSTRSSGRKVESSDTSSSSDDDDLAFYQPQRSGTRNKPIPNTSRINRANDFVESSGSQGTNWFDSRGSLPNTTQFEPLSTVVSDLESLFQTESINNTDSSAVQDENGDVSVPCLDFVPRRSTRRRNIPDRYGDWVMNSQQVYYV